MLILGIGLDLDLSNIVDIEFTIYAKAERCIRHHHVMDVSIENNSNTHSLQPNF